MAIADQRSVTAYVVEMPHSAHHKLRVKTMVADEQSLLVEEVFTPVEEKGRHCIVGFSGKCSHILDPQIYMTCFYTYFSCWWNITRENILCGFNIFCLFKI